MTDLPNFDCYCETTTAVNALVFNLRPGLRVWFSYRTPVAFLHNGQRVVRENAWEPTTGKHLNAIDGGDKAGRIPGERFEALLRDALAAREEAKP